MGLHLLNLSVDAADPEPDYIPEDLSFNDQESFIEFVIEKVLGYEDAIKEYDDRDTENPNNKKSAHLDLLVDLPTADKAAQLQLAGRKALFPEEEADLSTGFFEIDPPPPKV